jgi:hypothetical protein
MNLFLILPLECKIWEGNDFCLSPSSPPQYYQLNLRPHTCLTTIHLALTVVFCFWNRFSLPLPRLTSNSQSSCLPPKCWNYRHAPLHLVQFLDLLTTSHLGNNIDLVKQQFCLYIYIVLIPIKWNRILWKAVHSNVFNLIFLRNTGSEPLNWLHNSLVII